MIKETMVMEKGQPCGMAHLSLRALPMLAPIWYLMSSSFMNLKYGSAMRLGMPALTARLSRSSLFIWSKHL